MGRLQCPSLLGPVFGVICANLVFLLVPTSMAQWGNSQWGSPSPPPPASSGGSGSLQCGEWSAWGSCSKTCGSGVQYKTRSGSGCSTTSQARSCNTESCPPACSTWSAWASCSVNCGGGTQSRTRTGAQCSRTSESQSCNDEACPTTTTTTRPTTTTAAPSTTRPTTTSRTPYCSGWSAWGPCSVSCGDGSQVSTRVGDGCSTTSKTQGCRLSDCPTTTIVTTTLSSKQSTNPSTTAVRSSTLKATTTQEPQAQATSGTTQQSTSALKTTSSPTSSFPQASVLVGQMKLAAEGLTADDVSQAVRYALAVELRLGDESTIEVTVAKSRRLQNSAMQPLRRLVDSWTVSFSVRCPLLQLATVKTAADNMKSNKADFSATLKRRIVSELEMSGRSSSSIMGSFSVTDFSTQIVSAATTTAKVRIATTGSFDGMPSACTRTQLLSLVICIFWLALGDAMTNS